MKYFIYFSLLYSLLDASNYVVIANKNLKIDKLKSAEVKNIFLKKYKIYNNIPLYPLNVNPPPIIEKEFQKRVLRMSSSRLKNFWTKAHYLGIRPPKQVSLEDVVQEVRRQNGAISYTTLESLVPEIDIVHIVEGEKAIVIIANKSLHIKEISANELKMVFLKEKKILNNIDLVPVNLETLHPTRKIFEKTLLGFSRNTLREYWTKKHYMGIRPPVNLKSSQSVLSFVKEIEGAIGYIPIDDLSSEVDIVYEF